MTRELWPHQADAVDFKAHHPSALFYLGMGSGKTLAACETLRQSGALPALVLTRSSVVVDGIWERELDALGLRARPLTGRVAERVNSLHGADVFLTNYEGAWRQPLGNALRKAPWGTVILDESHACKSAGSSISKYVSYLPARNRLCLSGTPMAHTPLDIYGQFRFLDRSIYGTSYYGFRARYAVMGGYQGHQVIGYQNQDDLMRKFWQITFHVSDEDLKLSLPEATDVPMAHSLPAAARAIYHDLESEFYAELDTGTVTVANAAVKLLKLQRVAAGHVKDDEGTTHIVHTARADLLRDWLEDLPQHEPVVIFARFRQDLAEIQRVTLASGRTYSEVSGSTNQLIAWKEGTTDVLGVQIQSGSEGINLTRAALAVYYSIGHSLFQYQQSRARLVRPGQTRPVRFFHFTATGTVDQRVYRALRAREDVISALMNKARSTKGVLIS